MKQELIELICRKSFQYSQEPVFKLVSGRMSQFYVNCKPTVLSPRGMYLVGHLVFEAICDLDVKGVGGLTFGADPVAVATAFASELKDQPNDECAAKQRNPPRPVITGKQPACPIDVSRDGNPEQELQNVRGDHFPKAQDVDNFNQDFLPGLGSCTL